MYTHIRNTIHMALTQAVTQYLAEKNIAAENDLFDAINLEHNKESTFGDFSSNASLKAAKYAQTNPKALAREIIARILKSNILENICEKIEIAGPGFINFHLNLKTVQQLFLEILTKQESYGSLSVGKGKKVLIEFVSANPTGPLTIAHGRQAAVGDTLANTLELAGYHVLREYYLNDRGKQIQILGESTYLRYLELLGEPVDFPENYYQGDYLKAIAQEIINQYGEAYKKNTPENKTFFSDYTKNVILSGIKKDLDDFSVPFNSWFSEADFTEGPEIENMLKTLKEKGHTYTEENALWFRSTAFGDDKDRVLIRSNGEKTYIAPDIAYHRHKFNRGYDILINLLGPDHHGYISRLKAGVEALGYNKNNLNIIIVQLVTLYKEGKKLSMSTRAGEFVTLRDIMDEVGKDAARFFFAMRKTDSHLEFDLNLAKEESPNNPVYYVQYAHARICSIFKKYQEVYGKTVAGIALPQLNLTLLNQEEVEIIKRLTFFNRIIAESCETLEPQKIPQYLIDLVGLFHSYYTKNKVVSENAELTQVRLMIIMAVKIIIRNGLKLLGISAPETM